MPTNSNGYQVVDAPRPGEVRQSLLTAASGLGRIVDGTLPVRTAEDEPDAGAPPRAARNPDWTRGLVFRPGRCGQGGGQWVDCAENHLDLSDRPENRQYDPTSAVVGVDCSSMSEDARNDTGDEALDLLNNAQHRIIGAEFWRGDEAAAEGLPNASLAQGATDIGDGDSWPVIDALAALEESLAGVGDFGCGGGVRSMIHASPYTVSLWNAAGLLRLENRLILTILDTVVVTGPGYDGSGQVDGYDEPQVDPSGETAWAYGTGLVDVYLGGAKRGEWRDPDVNTIEARASRKWAVVWDGCCHVGILVDHTARS